MKVVKPVRVAQYQIGTGSQVEVNFDDKEKKPYLFLGQMLTFNGKTSEVLLLDEKTSEVVMFDPTTIKLGANKSKAAPVLAPVDQSGNTCTAYALLHYWLQTYSVARGNETLKSTMNNEIGRLKFLEGAIERYYIQKNRTLKGIMKEYGKSFGMTCESELFLNVKEAKDYLVMQTTLGRPVMIEFNIGPDMVDSDFNLTDYENRVDADPRLWVPRKTGQRNTGGHVIVGSSNFITKTSANLMVIDSDWTEPRVWNLDKYLDKKTAVDEIVFHTCY